MRLSRVVLVVLIIASILSLYLRYVGVVRDNRVNLEYLTSLYAERITSVIDEAASATEVLDSLLVANNGSLPNSEVITMMTLAYDEQKHIAIAYMPDGIITEFYPKKGYEVSIGYNVFNDIGAKHDAIIAMETKRVAFSGPYTMMIGVSGLVARNPVYYIEDGQEVFWGFVSAIIRPTDTLLNDTGLKSLEELGYEYSIKSNYNDHAVDLHASQNFSPDSMGISYAFKIGQAQWEITMYKRDMQFEIIQNLIIVFLIASLSSIVIYFTFRQSEMSRHVAHTQSLTDSLTNLYNRRALDKYEEVRKNLKKNNYTLFYLDLNKFKPVNDTFGHAIGDKLLSVFAERLLSQFRKDTFISRVGGDEFVIIFPAEQDEEQCKHVQDRLIRLAEDPFFIEGHEIRISSSIGFASYPTDGISLKEVLEKADKRMFSYKEEHRKLCDR